MASEEMRLVSPPPPQRLDTVLTSPLVFQDDPLRFSRVGDPGPKTTRELSGFIDDRYFQHQEEFRRSMYGVDHHRQDHRRGGQNWNGNGRTSTTPSGDGSEGDEEEDDDEDDDDDDEGDGEVEALVGVDGGNNNKNHDGNHANEHSGTGAIGNGKLKSFSSPYVGSHRGALLKECNIMQSGNDNGNARAPRKENVQEGRANEYQNAVTIADPDGDLYYSQYLQGPEGSGSGQKGLVIDNACGFSRRKGGSYSSESGESLRVILSDPITGVLMDDALILPCGHSFGSGGIQHILKMKACYTCSQPVSEESVSQNLSLRAAVQAFRREEEVQVHRSAKRRRDRFEQDKGNYGESIDHRRGRGVQFPFAVTDRVVIKGNKRTPQRFVGREAIVTTQCLNGWYVVKTLDNAESVKLQYRSLAKVSDNPSSKPMTTKMHPNWL